MHKSRAIAAFLLLVSVCNGTNFTGDASPVMAPMPQPADDSDQDFGLMGAVRYARNVAPGPQAQFEPELMQQDGHDEVQLMRFKRQLTVPKDSPLNLQGPQPAPNSATNFFSSVSELGTQLSNAKALSSLFSPSQQQQQQSGTPFNSPQSPTGGNPFSGLTSMFGGGNSAGAPGGLSMESVMRQLAELNNLIKSTQERNARTLEATQRSAENVGQETMTAAKSAQGGIQQALTEIGQGLSRMAANNPNLLPDIKNLYQSVAARLSSASSSVAQTAQSSPLNPGGNSNYPALPTAQS